MEQTEQKLHAEDRTNSQRFVFKINRVEYRPVKE